MERFEHDVENNPAVALTSFKVSLISWLFIFEILTLFSAYVLPSLRRVTLVTAAKAPLPSPPFTLKSFIGMVVVYFWIGLGRVKRI